MEMAASPLIAIGILATVAAVAPRLAHGRVALRRPVGCGAGRRVFPQPPGGAAGLDPQRPRPAPPPSDRADGRGTTSSSSSARRATGCRPTTSRRRRTAASRAGRRPPTSAWGCCRRWRRTTSGSSTTSELVERLEAALDTIERLERHEGHLLNWYETHTLAALWPRYVSTVDSGNLVAALMALDVGLHEVASGTTGRRRASRRPRRRRRVGARIAPRDRARLCRHADARPPPSRSSSRPCSSDGRWPDDRDVETAFVEEQGGALDRLLAEFDDQSIPDHELKTPPPLSTVRALRAALRRLSHEPAPVPRDALVLLGAAVSRIG